MTRIALLATLLTISLSATAEARTWVTGVGKHSVIAAYPRTFVAGSGVGGGVMFLKHAHWSHWGTSVARGAGKLTYNTCDPDCVSGKMKSVHTRIKLYRPRRNCQVYVNGE